MLYYNYDSFPASRFSDDYVRQTYPAPVSFTGDVGDGFCFDTNSIHQGTLSGSTLRDALILEFHDPLKFHDIVIFSNFFFLLSLKITRSVGTQ